MGMTAKDFKEIQQALADGHAATMSLGNPSASLQNQLFTIHSATCQAIAKTLARQNPKFDKTKFLTGCHARSY